MRAALEAFEQLVEDTNSKPNRRWNFAVEDIDNFSALKREFKTNTNDDTVLALKSFIETYFKSRNIRQVLQISIKPNLARIVSADAADFLVQARRIRPSTKGKSEEFENLVFNQLRKKVPGTLANFGKSKKTRTEAKFKAKLKNFGIEYPANRKVNDGGIDVLWLPPFGSLDSIPLINFQCKNTAEIDTKSISNSYTRCRQTCSYHNVHNGHFLYFVVINSLLTAEQSGSCDGKGFCYLGLSEILEDEEKNRCIAV